MLKVLGGSEGMIHDETESRTSGVGRGIFRQQHPNKQ